LVQQPQRILPIAIRGNQHGQLFDLFGIDLILVLKMLTGRKMLLPLAFALSAAESAAQYWRAAAKSS